MRLSIVTTVVLLLTFLMGCGSNQPEVNTSTDFPMRPPTVDVEVWNLLTSELARQLPPSKTSLSAPIGTVNEVDDLALVVNGSQATLSWTEKLCGDYDNNGEVNASDITPIAIFYGATAADANWQTASLADGDDNGEVNASDITPIAIHYLERLDGYQVLRSSDGENWELLPNSNPDHGSWSVDRPYPAPPNTRPSYQYTDVETTIGMQYQAVAFGDGETGAKSNIVVVEEVPNLLPTAIMTAEPTSGVAPLSVHLDGSESTDIDGTIVLYRWYVGVDEGEIFLGEGVVLDYVFEAGEYDVKLGVMDDDDAVAYSDSVLVSVAPAANIPPVAILSVDPSGGDSPLVVTLDASESSDIDGTIVWYEWDFDGDGVFDDASAEAIVEHTYTTVGGNISILEVSDDDGATDTDTALVTIQSPTVAPGDWWMFGRNPQHTSRSPFVGPQTNTLEWSYQTEGAVDSSPALDAEGNIYVGSNAGYLYAITPNGGLKWKSENPIGPIFAAPAVGEMVIYATDRGAAEMTGGLNFISPDGAIFDRYPAGESIVSSPAIGSDGSVYFGSFDGYLYAITPNGSRDWRYLIDEQIWSSPAVSATGVIYVGGGSSLYAIDSDGLPEWEYPADGQVFSSPAIGTDGVIYVGGGSSLLAINSDGTPKWDYPTGAIVISSPAIGADGTIYVGSDDSNLYAIDTDGALVWSYPTGGAVESSPAIGADGTIYVGSDDGKMYAINSDGTFKWEYLTEDKIFSSPTIGANGALYFGSKDDYIYAIKD